MTVVLLTELANLASARNIQVTQVRQPPTTQPLPPRQPPQLNRGLELENYFRPKKQ